jgi:hypothetical protein
MTDSPADANRIVIQQLLGVRRRVKSLTRSVDGTELFHVPDGFANHIAWNIGHMVVSQQLLTYRLSGLDLAIPEHLVPCYQKGSTPADGSPESFREIVGLLTTTATQLEVDYDAGRFTEFQPYTTLTGSKLNSISDALAFNYFHEGIHLGYALALNRAVAREHAS